MLNLTEELAVYVYTEPTDMRRGFYRLAGMVAEEIKQDPLSGTIYVFFSRRKDRVKLLYWDGDGYALWYKHLEASTFRIDDSSGYEVITGVDLKLLLQGMSLSRIKIRKKSKEGVFINGAA